MDDPALGAVDIGAIRDSIDALDGVDVQVEDIQQIDRSGDDSRVRWTMTCEADRRTTSLDDFETGDGDA